MSFAVKVYEAFKDDEVKAKVLAEFIESVEKIISNNQLATRSDLSATELRLVKEIESVRGEIKETELKLTKEIESVRGEIKETELKLTKEIESIRGEIKETELKLTKEIESVRGEIKETELKLTETIHMAKVSTIKWVVALFFAQTVTIIGVIAGFLKMLE
ncbi:MAG TPA: hypothetical protein PKX79_02070 [Spirochaetota bacterium]|nr:hypothetical protein [Spirochaetota bacterium]HPP94150.1 hypothetical protein [Spirochaetota bacterium]